MSPAYQQSTAAICHRRSLYSVWKRTTPLPNMMAFDAPSREVCTVARGRTNTPLQALVLLNDVQFIEAARSLAASVSKPNTELPAQIDEAFLSFTGRYLTYTERNLLAISTMEQTTLFADKSQQTQLPSPSSAIRSSMRNWTQLTLPRSPSSCQAILNLDATIYER